jgi:auxin influx carrier (AUX1 LAX family)
VFIPSFHNYRIWSFLGLGMTTYTAWYLAIAALLNGQVSPPHSHRHRIRSLLSTTDSASPSSSPTHMQAEGVAHSGPTKLVLYFTGATNILYTFGGHAVTV